MFSCFGKNDHKLPPEDPGNISPISNENSLASPNLKKNSKASNSEKEHIFLRAAHNGYFSKVQEALNSNIDVNSCNSNGLNALHLASKGGHADIVQFLIDNGADIGAKTRKNNTAIHIASLAGSLEVVKILVKHGANINEQSQTGFTPLYMAAQENHVGVVKFLLDNGADINLSTTDNFTPLAVAIQQGHEETVSILLNKSNFLNSNDISNDIKLPPLHIATRKDDYHAVLLLLHHQEDVQAALTQASLNGFTALHVAAYYNSDKVGRLLLENGAPVDYTSKNNVTALHVAAKWGRNKMVKVLLEFNANVEMSTRDGIRPLHCAASQGHRDICALLIEHKANCNTKTKNGLVPLHMVAQGNHSELVEFFINQNSVNVNETSLDFLTPLHISSHCNNVEVAEALIKHGANVNDRALNGFVALHIAAKQNHVKFVEMLMSNLCMIDTQTESGFTALHIASIIGSESIAKKLVENNCEIDIPDQFDRTSLHMATIFNHFNIVVYLKEHGGSVDKQMKTGETCLVLAIKSEHKAIVEYLINEGASLSVSDSWGLTALHWATLVVRENILNSNCTDININEAIEIFKFVLDGCSRFDINRTTKNGISSLHLAADCGCLEIVHLLLDKGADINIISINGTTPLHIACKNNNSNVLLVLLESLSYDSLTMAYVSCPWSPMHFSSYFGSVDSMILLISHENDQTSVREKLRQRTPNGNTCLHLAVQQLQTDIVRILLENDADFNLENEDGLSAFDMAKIVDDETIINLLGIDTTEMMTTDKVYLFQREEFSDEEQLETLYMDSLNELEFFGIGKNSGEKCELQLSIMSLLDYATTIDSIRRADMSLKINNSLNRYRNITLSEIKQTRELLIPAQPASMISTISSTNTEMSPFDVEKWDFHRVTDLPVNSGFLVSFLVDARGGYMQAQRMPQMKIFVPPDAAPAPTRIICHLLRPEGVPNLPGMNDCDGFASRILQIHSSCSRFQKPILIEMPYIALLKSNDREIVILKKNADSDTWKKHSNTFTEETLKAEFGSLYESITPVDQLESNRISRIITTDVPTYFSLISQFQRDVNMIGPDGGYIESKTDKRIKLTFPQGALMKKIQIGLEVQHVDPGIINHVVGDNHKISLSPIITVEPKRRKFRDLIEIQMGLPKGVTKNDIQDLKLLFSISEYITDWEDVTSSTELVLLENTNCMAHSTKISARVWLIYAPNVPNISELANKIYSLHCPTPYVGKFLSYARRHDQEECQIRCLLITDDTPDKTLECQESFELIATGPEVEVINKLQYQIECAGNIVAVTKSDEAILFPVQSFVENRITLPIRVRNQDEPFQGKIAFIPHFQSLSKQIVKPITTLDIIIPEIIIDMVGSFRNPDRKHRVKNATLERIKGCQAIAKTELDLKSVADAVGADWRALAEELELEADDINLVLNENCTDEEKAFMTLINWQTVLGFKATGNELNRALRQIGREDVVKSCIGDISFVEDEAEVKSAIEQLNNDDKKTHDECWDDIIASKGKPSGYNESVDDSMIVETGDDWSQSHRESKLSDISDDKSLVGESTHDSESEIKPLVDPSKAVTLIDRTSSEKTAAFLLLVNQLDEVLPHPVIHESYNSADKIEACEESVVKSFKTDKQVANVDQTISLLNLINCQINDDFVHVDTVIDLDDFFPEPQEIDVDTLSQSDLNDYGENRDQNEFVLEVCIPEDKVEGLIKNYEGCEITNTLMNMSRDENPKVNDKILQKDLLKRRRYTLDKARLLQHNETFHFHAPVSSLRRCFSVDSRRGRGIFSLCSQVNSLHEASILERGDWPSNEDLKNIQTLQIGVEDSDSPLDALDNKNDFEISEIIQTDIKTEEENSKIESKSYLKDILLDSPITDLDDLSLCDELEQSNEKKEFLEPSIVAGPLMSTMPSHLDIDLDTISPVTAGNFVYTQPVLFDDDKIVAENDYDTEKKEDINISYKNENPDIFKVDNSEVHSTSRYSVAGQTTCNAPFTKDKTVVNKDFELLNQQNTNLKETEITYNEPVDELETKMNLNQNFECPIQMKADVEIDSEHSGQFHNTDTDVNGVLNQLATDVVDQELLKDDLQSLDKECVKHYDCNIDINACTNESLSYAEPYSTDYQFIEKNIVEKEESEKNVENERTPESYRDDENINESKVNNNPQFETEKEISIRSDNFVYDPISDQFVTLDNDEALNQPEKHSVLHEVIESDPQIQTEVEEEVEVLPDGRIVNRKITRKQISRIITEKVTRDIEPENEENIDSKVTFESPPEVIETEEELPDGTILKRTISTSMKTTSTTAKTVTEKEISKDENSADSAAMRQSEALTDNGMDSSNTVSSLISDSAMYGPEESEFDSRSTMTIEENLSNLDLTFEEYETADESFESD